MSDAMVLQDRHRPVIEVPTPCRRTGRNCPPKQRMMVCIGPVYALYLGAVGYAQGGVLPRVTWQGDLWSVRGMKHGPRCCSRAAEDGAQVRTRDGIGVGRVRSGQAVRNRGRAHRFADAVFQVAAQHGLGADFHITAIPARKAGLYGGFKLHRSARVGPPVFGVK